jgi:light-regulated signal transduction histidine kinase (bacteriophytochrome)
MAELIDGLLELSRVTRAPMKRETVDLTAMVQELEASLRAAQPERAVDFVVAPAMVAMGDAVLLRAVLQSAGQRLEVHRKATPRAHRGGLHF